MATLEEVIRQRLEAATAQLDESKKIVAKEVPAGGSAEDADEDKDEGEDKVDVTPVMKKPTLTKESTVSSQVASLLEAEGLSEEFKTQAVTIFEAAVTDRVLHIEEGLKQDFDSQLAEAKQELENDIDGFLSEAIQQWKQENEVAIKTNFKTQVQESFIDGLRALIAEHNVEVPEGKENALETALAEVESLHESIADQKADISALQEKVDELKSEQIMESFKEKMATTEFDRFKQLTESVKFKDAEQYTKQLNIVLENFGSNGKTKTEYVPPIMEQISESVHKIVTESNSNMDIYTKYLSKKV